MFTKTKNLLRKAVSKDRACEMGSPIAHWEIKGARREMRRAELLISTLGTLVILLLLLVVSLGVNILVSDLKWL